MPVENTRSLAGNALAYLEARAGQKFSAVKLAREFGCCDHTMRAAERAGGAREDSQTPDG